MTKLKEKNPEEPENKEYENMVKALFGEGRTRKRIISRMVHHLIMHSRIEMLDEFDEPLIRYQAVMDGGPEE